MDDTLAWNASQSRGNGAVMTDIVSKDARSRMMARIGSKDTKPEISLRKALFAKGFRYRLHDRRLPGRPDIVLPKWNTAIFVHGCYWHRHAGCKYATTPSTRTEFWKEKFSGNKKRDGRNIAALRQKGWRVAVVWECAIRRDIKDVVELLASWIVMNQSSNIEIPTVTETDVIDWERR